jgi:hypothetical protein
LPPFIRLLSSSRLLALKSTKSTSSLHSPNQGLPESYLSLSVALNAIPPDQLKVQILIISLLNEETQQLGSDKKTSPKSNAAKLVILGQNK